MTDKLKALAKELSIGQLGIADLTEYKKRAIVCLFSYNTPQNEQSEKSRLSCYAYTKDYHIVVKEKLQQLAKPLIDSGFLADIYCDNNNLSDRYIAFMAGLGFFGKNSMLINDELGSKFFIGYILTDCDLECNSPLTAKNCIGCNKCIEACPSGAISENEGFNTTLCVSHLTQKRGELSPIEEEYIKKSGYIWGCDICQNVCPHNENAQITAIGEFLTDLCYDIDVDGISNKEFKNKYSDRAFSWRGKQVIARNKKLYK